MNKEKEKNEEIEEEIEENEEIEEKDEEELIENKEGDKNIEEEKEENKKEEKEEEVEENSEKSEKNEEKGEKYENDIEELKLEIQRQREILEELEAETMEEKRRLYIDRAANKFNIAAFKDLIVVNEENVEDIKESIDNQARIISELIEEEVNKRLDEAKNELLKSKGYKVKDGKKEQEKITKEEFDKMSYIDKLKLKQQDKALYRSLVGK